MHCTRKITDDLIWVGVDSRRQALFEAVYSIPEGVSYNSYLLRDEKNVLFDTVDRAVTDVFFENIEHALNGARLDYLVVQHMEPDHSATLTDVLMRYPECTVVCNQKTYEMICAFRKICLNVLIVKEGDRLNVGCHELIFIGAPMVHWPEVMVTYETREGIIFSADAFGCFGALGGALFADEVDFAGDYIDESRRYYCNIVGKYGAQVRSLLDKLSALDIKLVCPLHGFVWRRNIDYYVNKYSLWARYEPEEKGVLIAYASVYGNTENVVNALACALFERGIKCRVRDVSMTEASHIIADAFRCSHLVFASVTYNGGIFVSMENLLRDLVAHGLRARRIALIENGAWAPSSARQRRDILSVLPDTVFLDRAISIRSSLTNDGYMNIIELVKQIENSF